jgi:hypothetical protein
MKAIVLAGAAVLAATGCVEAKNHGSWHVVLQSGTGACFSSRTPPGRGMYVLPGNYATRQHADKAIQSLALCDQFLMTLNNHDSKAR